MSETDPTLAALQTEVAILHQQLAAAAAARQQAEQHARVADALIHRMPVGAVVWHLEDLNDLHSFRLISVNPANQQIVGVDLAADIGRRLVDIMPGVPEETLILFAETVRSGQVRDLDELRTHSQLIGGRSSRRLPSPCHISTCA